MNEIPTPETDALVPTQGNKQTMLEYIETLEAHTCGLERRLAIEKNRANEMGKLAHANACEAMEYRRFLTVAREALQSVGDAGGSFCDLISAQRKAEEALALTAQKP